MAVPGTLRTLNDQAVLALLLDRGPLTRPQIAAATGLSKPTVSQVLTRLRGLVTVDGVRAGLPGRTAEVHRVDPTAATAAAVDVTPRRIAVRVVRVTGEVVGEHRLPTPGRSGGDVLDRLRSAIAAAGADPAGLDHVVIGVPGAVDPRTGRLAFAAHLPGWHRPNLVDWLTEGLGADVAVENDVNLAAEAERADGELADFALYWGAEGIGTALVLGGRLHRGAGGGAGEIGYLPVPGAPTARDVGRMAVHGLQSIAGGAAIGKLLRANGFRGADTTTALAAAAAADHAVVEEIAHRVALGIAAVVAVVDPGVVVLSGHIVLAGGEPLRARVERALHALALPQPPVRRSTVAVDPVLAGAVVLARARTRDTLLARLS
ncbi:ROK family transcriptional regulator [Actinokineospora sp. 24-640]